MLPFDDGILRELLCAFLFVYSKEECVSIGKTKQFGLARLDTRDLTKYSSSAG